MNERILEFRLKWDFIPADFLKDMVTERRFFKQGIFIFSATWPTSPTSIFKIHGRNIYVG